MSAAGQLGRMKKRVTVSSSVAARKPANVGFAAAAAPPMADLTAYYALHDLAHIGPGDRVSIQAAAGGVGQPPLRG